jgi:hypothetical protein
MTQVPDLRDIKRLARARQFFRDGLLDLIAKIAIQGTNTGIDGKYSFADVAEAEYRLYANHSSEAAINPSLI